ncbi:AraC family transcriptional regulator, partial [Aduncisulcus paluster]
NNIVAVASLLDFACVIVPEGIDIPENVVEKASEEDVAILGTEMGSYDIFKCLYEAGLK